jgi:GntR family transcriptional regulator/MocR family aminotransferase
MPKQSPEINPAGIRLSKDAATPLYTQLYEQVRQMILTGRLRSGERLPASRNLALELGVSRVIVSQAYELLMMEGYLVGKTGSGTFVAALLPDHLLNAKAPAGESKENKNKSAFKTSQTKNSSFAGERSEVLPFQMGTPSLDQFPYQSWQRVGNKVLQALNHIHLGYEDTMGYLPLRKAIASYLRVSRAVSCEPEQVIVVTGSQQGYFFTFLQTLNER